MRKNIANPNFYTVEPCASARAYEIKLKDKGIDLGRAAVIGEVVAQTPVVLITKFKGHGISIYASGRVMVKGLHNKGADQLSKKLISLLQKARAIL